MCIDPFFRKIQHLMNSKYICKKEIKQVKIFPILEKCLVKNVHTFLQLSNNYLTQKSSI